MQGRTDEELLVKFTETGDTRFFDELVTRHIEKVRHIVFAVVFNNADADDITQEVFLKAMRGATRFRYRARFQTWLYRIAVNASKDFLRRKQPVTIAYNEEYTEHSPRVPAPDTILGFTEIEKEIDLAMADMSPELRTAVVLVLIQDISPGEAAKIAQCLPATMYWRVHQARKHLKKRLARYLEQ